MPTDRIHETAPLPDARRYALVIGTAEYRSAQYANLPGAANDARDMRDVLADSAICGFGAVQTLVNEPVEKIRRAVNEIFDDDRSPEDLVLVYLSCHGVRDLRGRLHFAATDTDPDVRAATTVSARELGDMADDCPARRKIIILDSCYSGAFGAKAVDASDLMRDFGNESDSRGLTVLTASRSAEYAFAHRRPGGGPAGSVFTTALVEGLRTGRADFRNSGWITVQDAYRYAHSVVRQHGRRQTPQMQLYNAEGADIVLARSPAGIRAGDRDVYQLVRDLERPHPKVRRAAVETLGDLLRDDNPAIAVAARENLKLVLATDQSPELVNLAKALLAGEEQPGLEPHVDDMLVPPRGPRPRASRPGPTDRSPPPAPIDVPAARYEERPAPGLDWNPLLDPGYEPPPYSADEPPAEPLQPGGEHAAGTDDPDQGSLWDEEFMGLRPAPDPLGVFAPRRVVPLEPEPSRSVVYYLFPTERFRGEWRRHWIDPIVAAALSGVASGAVWHPVDVRLLHLPGQMAGASTALVLRAVLLVAAVAAAWRALVWHGSRIVLTNKRILLVRGILLRRTTSASLQRMTNIRSSRTPIGRLLGYGTLSFTAGRMRPYRIRHLPQFAECYLRIVEELYEPGAVEARLRSASGDEDEAV